jgi:hypothetical protein
MGFASRLQGCRDRSGDLPADALAASCRGSERPDAVAREALDTDRTVDDSFRRAALLADLVRPAAAISAGTAS